MASSAIDSPEAMAALDQFRDRFTPRERHQGRRYFAEGRVESCRGEGAVIDAFVVGSDRYWVRLSWREGAWTSRCTCPVGAHCKHAFATLLAWMDKQTGAAVETAAPAPEGERPGGNPAEIFRTQTVGTIEARLGRSLTRDEGAFLERLHHVWHSVEQSGRLLTSDLRTLGLEPIDVTGAPEIALASEADEGPPADPIALWQELAYHLEEAGRSIPPFLRPITDTSAVRAQRARLARRQAVQRWTDRFEQLLREPPPPLEPPAPPAPVATEQLRLCLHRDGWELQTRPHDLAAWKKTRGAWLDAVLSRPEAMAQYAGDPAAFAFLALCHARRQRHRSAELGRDDPVGRELVHELLLHPLARQLVTGPNGAPLRFVATPLRWQVEATAEGAEEFEVSLRRPDGSALPAGAVHLPGRPHLYYHDQDIYRGPPPLDGHSAAAAIVPAEVVRGTSVLRGLLQQGAVLPPALRESVLPLPLQPRLECRLASDASGQERLELRLRAESDSPRCKWSWTPGQWQEQEAAPATFEGKTVLVDHAPADAVARRLPAARVEWDPTAECWTRRVGRNFPEEFSRWRGSLPADVAIDAEGPLAELLQPAVRATIDLQLVEAGGHHDWFDLTLALRAEDTTLTAEELGLLLKANGRLVRLPGRGWRRLEVELDASTQATLEELGFDADTIGPAAAGRERHRFHALQLAELDLETHLTTQQAEQLRKRARAFAEAAPPPVPTGLQATLRPYQVDGYHFLCFLARHGLGGILADDMGLGKTVQTLAWFVSLVEQSARPEAWQVLVVCPKSVMGNWETEAARFTPQLRVRRFTPATPLEHREPGAAGPLVVVANYTQLRLHADTFKSQSWQAVVLDEGQFIKNPTAKVAQVARSLPTAHRLVLTGTPVENRLLDLWSLFAFALPGLLGTQAAFKRLYPPDDPQALARLRTRVRHFLLRRTKAQVAADLPPRTEEELLVDLEGEQATLYQAELKRARAQLLGIRTDSEFGTARFNILASLLRLRQICCHPALVGAPATAASAKLEALVEHVAELRDEGHQVLVFSQFVSMLDLIAQRLQREGIAFQMLTGQTENRDERVARFQSDPTQSVFLLSLKAAGFGLNLTAASYVILFDPWWNPAVEAQAIDRTHRIGQTSPVIAYRLIARGTIEEKIRRLQQEKAALASAIVQEESLQQVLDLDSLREILS